MSESALIENVRFDEKGLIPAIVQDVESNAVIGLFYMDNDSLLRTLKSGQTYLRDSRGEISRQRFRLVDVRLTSEGESLNVRVEMLTAGKIEDESSSFSQGSDFQQPQNPEVSLVDVGSMEFGIKLNELYGLIADRKDKRPEGSYTTYLFTSGLDKILKKIAEESGEVIIAAKNQSSTEIVCELSDLFYHLLVLMVERGVKLEDVQAELSRRSIGSPKREDSAPAAHKR